MARFQYQIKTQPVRPGATWLETTQLDKWYRQTETPQATWSKRAKFSLAAMVAGAVFVNIGSTPTVASQTAPVVSFPKVVQYQARAVPVLVPAAAEVITVDKWQPHLDHPTRGIPSRRHTFPSTFLDPFPRTIADSIPADNLVNKLARIHRVLPKPHLYPSFFTDPSSLTLSEDVSLDKWFQPASEPRRDVRRLQHLYLWSQTGLEEEPDTEVSVDSWYVVTSEPRRDLKRWQHLYPLFANDANAFTRPEQTNVDKWFAQSTEPRRSPTRAHLAPVFQVPPFIEAAPTVSVDSWHVIAVTPIRKVGRAHLVEVMLWNPSMPTGSVLRLRTLMGVGT